MESPNAKYAPRGSSGKAVTIYPSDEGACERILAELDERLDGAPGPYTLSDLSLDPPAHSGRSFPGRFLHEEFSGVNRGASVLPLALLRLLRGSGVGGRGSG